MMFRLTALFALAALATSEAADANSTALEEDTRLKLGDVCELDSDCFGNLDCQSTRNSKKLCLPISCAKGAAWALLDYGFDTDGFVHDVLEKADLLNGRSQWRRFSDEENANLMAAVRDTPVPMDVFNANYTACMNPGMSDGRRLDDGEEIDNGVSSYTGYGVQWSLAALFAYFGKYTAWQTQFLNTDFNFNWLMNCVGVLGGVDAGVDFLVQIFDNNNDDGEGVDFAPAVDSRGEQTRTAQLDFIHVITAGPLGIQVGWLTEPGPRDSLFTEITIGGSFGGALLGYTRCFSDLTIESALIP